MTHPESQAELLPCPFCGGDAEIDQDMGGFAAYCVSCDCAMDVYGPLESTIAAWNRRAAPPPEKNWYSSALVDAVLGGTGVLKISRVTPNELFKAPRIPSVTIGRLAKVHDVWPTPLSRVPTSKTFKRRILAFARALLELK